MAAAPDGGLEEALKLCDEMRSLYESQEDAQKVAQLRALRRRVHDACAEREEAAATAIREMTGRVAELEHTAAAAESPGSRGATLAAAEGAARVARARAASLAADAASLSAESGALASASARLAARAEAEEAEAGSAVATLRKYLALYAHFTQLSWDAGAGAGRAKGRVVDAAAGDVRFFDEDEAALSPAQLAARLWGVVQGGA